MEGTHRRDQGAIFPDGALSPSGGSGPHAPVFPLQIVVDDGKNEKMVMKNAHEIAILSTLSHPHVTQVRDRRNKRVLVTGEGGPGRRYLSTFIDFLSRHPSIPFLRCPQAYLCLTDVLVEDLNNSCMRQAHQTVLVSPAYKYMQSMLDKMCHIEVRCGTGKSEASPILSYPASPHTFARSSSTATWETSPPRSRTRSLSCPRVTR